VHEILHFVKSNFQSKNKMNEDQIMNTVLSNGRQVLEDIQSKLVETELRLRKSVNGNSNRCDGLIHVDCAF
jgi:hypothetical protein